MAEKTYDLLAMGRCTLDLYSNDNGAAFPDIRSFNAYVGGCPTNICVGARRLGLRTAILTALGDDLVADFTLQFLNQEGIDTRFARRLPGKRTGAAILGIQPPDRFPLVYYRANCADIELSIEDVVAAPVNDCRVLLISGTGLSRDPSRSATLFAAEEARAASAKVVLVLDFRADQWNDPRAFGVTTRSALRLVDVVIGTSEEVKGAASRDPAAVSVAHSQVTDARVRGDLQKAVDAVLSFGPEALVMTRGEKGAAVHTRSGECLEAPPFPVEIYNTIGAGDAFASGFLYGYLKGWNWAPAARMGNACGAIVVTRHGCANFMPYEQETLDFIGERGGFGDAAGCEATTAR